MAVRVGINGFGRIGRNFLRSIYAEGATSDVAPSAYIDRRKFRPIRPNPLMPTRTAMVSSSRRRRRRSRRRTPYRRRAERLRRPPIHH